MAIFVCGYGHCKPFGVLMNAPSTRPLGQVHHSMGRNYRTSLQMPRLKKLIADR